MDFENSTCHGDASTFGRTPDAGAFFGVLNGPPTGRYLDNDSDLKPALNGSIMGGATHAGTRIKRTSLINITQTSFMSLNSLKRVVINVSYRRLIKLSSDDSFTTLIAAAHKGRRSSSLVLFSNTTLRIRVALA